MSQEIDQHAVKELDLYWSNDADLYKLSEEWVQLYYRKMQKGIYNEELALQGIVNNFVPNIIRKYRKKIGINEFVPSKINAATKIELGKEIMISITDGLNYLISKSE